MSDTKDIKTAAVPAPCSCGDTTGHAATAAVVVKTCCEYTFRDMRQCSSHAIGVHCAAHRLKFGHARCTCGAVYSLKYKYGMCNKCIQKKMKIAHLAVKVAQLRGEDRARAAALASITEENLAALAKHQDAAVAKTL